jgi:hypothetical protein
MTKLFTVLTLIVSDIHAQKYGFDSGINKRLQLTVLITFYLHLPFGGMIQNYLRIRNPS